RQPRTKPVQKPQLHPVAAEGGPEEQDARHGPARRETRGAVPAHCEHEADDDCDRDGPRQGRAKGLAIRLESAHDGYARSEAGRREIVPRCRPNSSFDIRLCYWDPQLGVDTSPSYY